MKGKSKMTTTSAHRAENIPVASRRDAESDFKAAFEEHWSWVYAMLCRVVGDEDEAEDLALEVFCRLHEKPPREQSGLASWLYRVAINIGLNALRARQRRRRYEEAAGVQKLQQAAPEDPADEVERRERARHVRYLGKFYPQSLDDWLCRVLHCDGVGFGSVDLQPARFVRIYP